MSKPTLIMLPAFMCNEALFEIQIEKLKDNCNILVPVLKDYSNISEAAKYILNIAPKEFYLVGISMGGYIAMELVKLAKERILKLCLMATKSEEDTPNQKNIRLKGIKLVEETQNVIATKSYLSSMLYTHKNDPKVYDIIQDMNAKLGPNTYINQQKLILSRTSFEGCLATYTEKALVIAGMQDTLTTPDSLKRIAEEIPNSVYISINNCGHLIPLDQPTALTTLLEYFIKI